MDTAKLSRWIRCLLQIALPRDVAVAEEILGRVEAICRDLKAVSAVCSFASPYTERSALGFMAPSGAFVAVFSTSDMHTYDLLALTFSCLLTVSIPSTRSMDSSHLRSHPKTTPLYEC